MVKSVSCCFVRGSQLFSDLVTFYPSDDLSSRNDSPGLISLTVNCQSLLAKRDSFMNLIDTYHPDIIFGTESWLNPDIASVNFSQNAILSIINTEKMDMVVYSLPAENIFLHAV